MYIVTKNGVNIPLKTKNEVIKLKYFLQGVVNRESNTVEVDNKQLYKHEIDYILFEQDKYTRDGTYHLINLQNNG